jgi:hypothetical protein
MEEEKERQDKRKRREGKKMNEREKKAKKKMNEDETMHALNNLQK